MTENKDRRQIENCFVHSNGIANSYIMRQQLNLWYTSYIMTKQSSHRSINEKKNSTQTHIHRNRFLHSGNNATLGLAWLAILFGKQMKMKI